MGIKACNPMVTNFNFVLTQFCSATSKLSSWIWKDMLLLDELVCSTRNAWNSQHGRQRLQYSIKLFEMQGSSSSGLTGLPQKESDNISGTFYRFQCLCAQSNVHCTTITIFQASLIVSLDKLRDCLKLNVGCPFVDTANFTVAIKLFCHHILSKANSA